MGDGGMAQFCLRFSLQGDFSEQVRALMQHFGFTLTRKRAAIMLPNEPDFFQPERLRIKVTNRWHR